MVHSIGCRVFFALLLCFFGAETHYKQTCAVVQQYLCHLF